MSNKMAEAGVADDNYNQETFEKAADHLTQIASNLTDEQLLYFYARYKQAKDGRCHIPKPGFFNFQAKQKWEAWHSLGDMSQSQARQQYILEISRLDPSWLQRKPTTDKSHRRTETLGLSVSTLRGAEEDTLSDDQKSVFDWAKECNVERVAKELLSHPDVVDDTDEEGMTLLHWASDRGSAELIGFLISRGSNINQKDNEGQTPLHYASSCGHVEAVETLLKAGADVNLVDNEEFSPADVAADDAIRKALKAPI